jgi:hypothetical protein
VQRLSERNIKVPNKNSIRGRGNTIKHNIPLITLYILGSIIMFFLGILFLIAYITYCIVSTLWVMRFVCTHCPHYDKYKCPSGYSIVAGKLFKKRSSKDFRKVFARNIGVVVPSWVIPAIVGIYLLWIEFTMELTILVILFIIVGFVILPIASRRYGCDKCDLKDQCPWMGKFGK